MRNALSAIRGLALVGVALSLVALPVGAILLAISLPQDRGDNALGDIIATGLGIGLLVLGGAGLILGGVLSVLAKRALAISAEISRTRRRALIAGLAVAGGVVLISSLLAGSSQGSPSGSMSFFVGLSALFAAPFVVVAAATMRRVDSVLAGVLAVVLLGLAVAALAAQLILMVQPQP